ncbi:HIT-like domain-containing protein [Trichophaea hybrida]|nr:HIT-like domain-containing protein [Trichophaea hybrida]
MSFMPNETLVMLHQQALARGCTFCAIASNSPPFDPTLPRPPPSPSPPPPDSDSGHIVLSTPDVIAFLDILPLTRAHVLVCPREHREKLSDLSPAENAVIGDYCQSCVKVVEHEEPIVKPRVNAAQVVPHAHYHIIPRPDERQREKLKVETPEDRKRWWKSPFGSGWRSDLDDEEGAQLAAALRAEVEQEVESLRKDPNRQKDTRFLASL